MLGAGVSVLIGTRVGFESVGCKTAAVFPCVGVTVGPLTIETGVVVHPASRRMVSNITRGKDKCFFIF